MNSFWNEYPNIQSELEVVSKIIKNNIKTNEKVIENALLELLNSGGKLLRPAFLIISGKFGDYNRDKILPLAAVIEMLHMATLVHDDIIDDSLLRRNSPTTQAKYGKDVAVFMGDYLFSRCFLVLSKNNSMEDMQEVAKVISTICKQEINQFTSRFSEDMSIKKYLKRIGGKTAALFALSFYVGAKQSNCDEKLSRQLGRIGYEIGMAFQIVDDILDYTGEEKEVGKPVGNDLKEGLYTLPLISAYKKDKTRLEGLLSKESMTEENVNEIIKTTIELGGIEKSRELAIKYTNKTFKRIKALPNCESKNILLRITEKLLKRKY